MTPPTLSASRFPVSVTTPTGDVLDKARLVLTVADGDQAPRLMVWTRPGEPHTDVPYDADASTVGRNNQEWRLVSPLGDYLVRPRQGCRCGPLARWEPFEPMTIQAGAL